MGDRLQRLIIGLSKSWQGYVLVAVLAVGSFAALTRIGARFPALAGGHAPFDLQNALAPGEVYAQLAAWSPAARSTYYLFSAVDWVFPLAAGLWLAATITYCLRRSLPGTYARATRRRLLPLLLLATACDWLENLFAVAAVAFYPAESTLLAQALVAAKRAKLAFLAPTQGLLFALVLYAAARALVTRRSPPGPPAPPPPGPPARPTGT